MDIRVRPAKASDKEQLMSFIKDVWGGHDYVPRIWDEWLKDPSGRMFVVLVDGHPVGMNRVRFLKDGSAWFEGARVHPQFRGKGLASRLGEASMRYAISRGVKAFRLTSWSRNRAAHRQIARMDFKESSRISAYEPGKGARFEPQKGVVLARAGDLARLADVIRESREFRLGSGVYWDAFKASALSVPMLRELISEGAVWTAGASLMIAKPGGEAGEIWRQVCFLTGNDDEAMTLVRHAMGANAGKRTTRRIVYLPQGSRMIGVVRKMGFKRLTSLVLFERPALKD